MVPPDGVTSCLNKKVMSPRLNSFGLLLLIFLAGCATHTPPVPQISSLKPESLQFPRRVFVTETKPVAAPIPFIIKPLWQVVVQQEGEALRWLRFDLLGAPDARQILENGRWRNDGFIHPNPEAREMFAALLFAWMQNADLDAAYGAGHWLYRDAGDDDSSYAEMDLLTDSSDLKPRWTVIWSDTEQEDSFTILRHKDGIRWEVRPVPENHSSENCASELH